MVYMQMVYMKCCARTSSILEMAAAPGTESDEKPSDVPEVCSICTDIFTNPKALPCGHAFCLRCLEKYGKDMKPGDQMACPVCGNDFAIPDGGLTNLPNSYPVTKTVEIEKSKDAACDLCFEQGAPAEMICIDCDQKLCNRCSKSHTRIKDFQDHQVVELGSQLNSQELNLRNSYCEHHPNELIKMYCYEDNAAICLVCCVESHQSHRCVNVEKAAEEFMERLQEDRKTVTNRLTECEEVEQKLLQYEKEFTQQISETEEYIRDTGAKQKKLIDDHTEALIQDLKSVTDRNMYVFESTRQDVYRFREMIESYSRNSEDLLSQRSLIDICKAADQMHTRASELDKLPANCSGGFFRCDAVAFKPLNLEDVLDQSNTANAVGELTVTESQDRKIRFENDCPVRLLPKSMQAFYANFNTVKVSGLPRDASKDVISLYFEDKKLSGGGKLTVLEHQEEEGRAVIKFDNPEDAMNVCKRRHVLCGATLRISALEMLLDGIRSYATEARSLGERAAEYFLESYLQRRVRPGFRRGPFFHRH